MKATVRWTTVDGTFSAGLSTDQFVPIEHGFRKAFVAMPAGCPDLFVYVGLDGQVAVMVCNGRYTRPPTTIIGIIELLFVGVSIKEQLTLHDGTARVIRLPEPPTAKEHVPGNVAFMTWCLRDAPPAGMTDLAQWFGLTYNPYFKGKPGQDLPGPDIAGSPRICQYLWAGALGPAYLLASGLDIPQSYRAAALDWTDQQFRRPCLYYDDKGELLRHEQHQDVWVDQTGWRKGLHGKIARPSSSTWTLEDNEHLTIDRQLTAALLWEDPVAWLNLDCWGEVLCSRPLCHGYKLVQNQREIGYTIRSMALLKMAFGALRPQFGHALERALSNLTLAFGTAQGRPYPSRAPPHTGQWSHGYPNKQDTENYFSLMGWAWPPELDLINDGNEAIPWLQAKAVADGKSKYAYTINEGGLFDYLRAVVVWQCGVILSGLTTAASVTGVTPQLTAAIKHVAACILGPGHEGGIGQNEASFSTPTFHDSYAALWPWRKTACPTPWAGTVTWIAPALATAAPLLSGNLMPEAKAAALLLRNGSSFAKLPAVTAIETFFPTLGL